MSTRKVRLGDVAAINPKLSPRERPDLDSLVSFLPMAGVCETTMSVKVAEERLYSDVAKGYTPFQRDDLLIAKITPCFENGKFARATGLAHRQAFGSTEFHVLRASERVDPNYLFHLLRVPDVRSAGAGRMKGAAGHRRVPTEFFAELAIPLPELVEQKRIARALDAADTLRAKRRESITKLDALVQSTFLEMFGDPLDTSTPWPTVTVGDEVGFLTSGSRGWAKFYRESGAAFIRIQNLRHGVLDAKDLAFVDPPVGAEAKRTAVTAGDVLLSITADLGRLAVVPPSLGPAHINQHLAILRFKKLDPVFVAQQLSSQGGQHQFARLNREGVKAGLNFADIRSIQLRSPPLHLQVKYAESVASIQMQKSRLRLHLAELDTLLASLQSRAFAGEL